MNRNHAGCQSACRGAVLNLIKVAVVALQLFIATQAFAVAPDKRAHFTGGSVAGLGFGTVTYHLATEMGPAKRMAVSTGLALIPGLIVEISDEFGARTSFSWGDILADSLGAVTGVIAAELINGQLWVSASGRQIRLIGHW